MTVTSSSFLRSNCPQVMADPETESVAPTTVAAPSPGDALANTVVDLEDDPMDARPGPSLDCAALKARIMEDINEVLDRFPTPTHYLASIARPEFAEWLWDTFQNQMKFCTITKPLCPAALKMKFLQPSRC